MSVSSRSPRNTGRWASKRSRATSKIGVSGLPATTGSRPTAVCTAETSVPLPGAMPRATGMVQSVLVATHTTSGSASANAASASWAQPTSGEKPCTTAAGLSSVERVTT